MNPRLRITTLIRFAIDVQPFVLRLEGGSDKGAQRVMKTPDQLKQKGFDQN